MAQGWHKDTEGHRRAGRMGGLKSAETRRKKAALAAAGKTDNADFGEKLSPTTTAANTKATSKTASK